VAATPTGARYKITIDKEGYESAELLIEKKAGGWLWGNLGFGGVIGLIVDFSNGAAYRLKPDELQATLNSTTISHVEEDGVTI